ncbi:MAG: hypothetical protein EOO24_26120, partial [Comamonadaceae bacterium]
MTLGRLPELANSACGCLYSVACRATPVVPRSSSQSLPSRHGACRRVRVRRCWLACSARQHIPRPGGRSSPLSAQSIHRRAPTRRGCASVLHGPARASGVLPMRFSTAGVRLHAEGDPVRLTASAPRAADPLPHAALPIRSIVVVTDLSSHEHIAVHRAAQLAVTHGAALRFVYLPARSRDVPLSPAGLAAAARQLHASLALPMKVVPVRAGSIDDLAELTKGADLLVLPHRRERSTAAFFRG